MEIILTTKLEYNDYYPWNLTPGLHSSRILTKNLTAENVQLR